MNIETVSELNIDLKDEKQLLNMLEERVYEIANSATIEVKKSMSGPAYSDTKNILNGDKCDLLIESLYINEKYPLLVNKFYIPERFNNVIINITNK
jgi:hypothetical protein